MDWGISNAHLELLICDQPLISYKKNKSEKGNHTKKEMDNIMEQWKAKREAQGKSCDFRTGIKMNLNDFLRTGADAFNNTNTK